MTDEKRKPDVKPEKTVMRALALGGMLGGGGECALDIKNGKVLRIRPFHYDWKYDAASFRPWTIKRNGASLSPLMKSLPSPFSLAYKKRTFSPNRIKYPMKRVDWDPKGERNPLVLALAAGLGLTAVGVAAAAGAGAGTAAGVSELVLGCCGISLIGHS